MNSMHLPVTYERGVPHPLRGGVDTGSLGVVPARFAARHRSPEQDRSRNGPVWIRRRPLDPANRLQREGGGGRERVGGGVLVSGCSV